MSIYQNIKEGKNKKIALLIDPDKHDEKSLEHIVLLAEKSKADYFFVGGSLLMTNIEETISVLKNKTSIPVIIFPGNVMQVSDLADGILFLSMISGRNPDLLIGQHVVSALRIKNSKLEVLPTGYILIENGRTTSVEYMSNTKPIPPDKPEIAVATAVAGEMLGLKLIYLEAGSGATNSVGLQIISEVRKNISLPILVGGGIRNFAEARKIFEAGANLIVIGSIIEENPETITELCFARNE
jgi:putative glycerol-1-phosphate prenyltransferase